MSVTKSWNRVLETALQDPNNLLHYLNTSLVDEDRDLFLIALKKAAKFQLGGMTALAEETNLSRESLYRTLSLNGNPRFSTLVAILEALGFQLAIVPKKKVRKSSKPQNSKGVKKTRKRVSKRKASA